MKQIIQTLKNGKVQIMDVPPPMLCAGMVLVRNHYSLIRPGTERSTVSINLDSGYDSKSIAKEYIEVNKAGILGDFKELKIHGSGRVTLKKPAVQDKGQAVMIKTVIDSIKGEKSSPFGFDNLNVETLTTFRMLEFLRTRKTVPIREGVPSQE